MKELKQILIIGGSSFVARNIISSFSNNYNIKVVSRAKTGYSKESLFSDFFSIPEQLFKGVDVVINCAAIVHQQKVVEDIDYHKINYELAVDLAEKAKKNEVNKFIQLSTISVYGNQSNISKETEENPLTPYGKSKLAADEALIKLNDSKFNVIIFRPPMIYGKVDAPGNMMKLIKLVNKGVPLPFKNVLNKRDFIHIDNLVGFIRASIKKDCSGVFLVSDNHSISTSELCKLIAAALHKKSKLIWMPKICFGLLKLVKPNLYFKLISNSILDIKSTVKLLEFEPKNLLQSGLREMIE